MNDIITFPKVRVLAANARLRDYVVQSIGRFEELKGAKLFDVQCEWAHGAWGYRANGGESIVFVRTPEELVADELIDCLKCETIDYLYSNRLKGVLPGLSGRTQGFRKLIQAGGIKNISQLNQDSYVAFLNEIGSHALRTQSALIYGCNRVIKWLAGRDLLAAPIDLSSPPSLTTLPAIASKMPSRDLIQCLLEARWKIAENEDDTLQWANDMISVLAQSFQYGMGLRIGETLRLPKDPLEYRDGKMFFIVWTEKGKAPLARYVPTEWQEVFETSIREIQRITEPYRKRAIELETTGRLCEVEDSLKRFREEKERDFSEKLAALDLFLAEKNKNARDLWTRNMRGVINPDSYFTVRELQNIVPAQVTSDAYANKLAREQFEIAGIEFEVDPADATRHVRYRTTGQCILDCIEREIAFRANHLTDVELLSIIHEREFNWESKENQLVTKYLKERRDGGAFRRFTMRGVDEATNRGTVRKSLTMDEAIEILRAYCLGGYDYKEWIDVGSFNQLFLGDIFHSETSITTDAKFRKRLHKNGLIVTENRVQVYHKCRSVDLWKYQSHHTYLIKQDSIHEYLLSKFKEANLNAEREIYEESLEVDEESNRSVAVRIESQSFHVMQKVSDHLLLTGKTNNGGGQRLVPTLLSYPTLIYSFVGGGRKNYPGLFERYGITSDRKIISEFQTHKGRHWKTTSLFRSGASAEIVNLWMGRNPNQGSQYDHNTDRDRAEKVKAALKEDSNRFVGHVAAKLRAFQAKNIHKDLVDEFLDQECVTVQHSDRGMCKRELALKPCELSMHCLSGKDGKGCKDYIIDLADVGQIERLTAWSDREQRELSRLESHKEMGIAAAQAHLNARTPVFRNAVMILDTHKKRESLANSEIRPFYLEGSTPNDCPFGCGD